MAKAVASTDIFLLEFAVCIENPYLLLVHLPAWIRLKKAALQVANEASLVL